MRKVRLMTPGQREQLATRIFPADLTADEAQKLIEAPKTGEFFYAMDEVFAAHREFNPTCFRLVVPYDRKLEEQFAAGNYDQVYDNGEVDDFAAEVFTSSHFPSEFSGTMTLVGGRLVRFDDCCSGVLNTEAVARIKRMGRRPGNAHELAAFGIRFPRVQQERGIIALGGKRWEGPAGEEYAAILNHSNAGYCRNLCVFDMKKNTFFGDYWYLTFPQ